MKATVNNFSISGFVTRDAEIRQFTNASVARFSIAVSRTEKTADETNRVTAFLNLESWRKNNSDSFDLLKKGNLITCEGFMKPDAWQSEDGVNHSRMVWVATKFYLTPDKEDAPQEETKSKKKG